VCRNTNKKAMNDCALSQLRLHICNDWLRRLTPKLSSRGCQMRLLALANQYRSRGRLQRFVRRNPLHGGLKYGIPNLAGLRKAHELEQSATSRVLSPHNRRCLHQLPGRLV
jgi:hypothetical protein